MLDTPLDLVGDLFRRQKRDLLAYLARRAGRDDASDLLQETFARALRCDRLASVADPPAYLQSIAVNLVRDLARRRATEAKHFEPGDVPVDVPTRGEAPDEQVEKSQRDALLRAAVEALPPRCREVFVLVMHEDVPAKEAARRLGMTETMARRHLRLALQRCRAALD